MRIVRNAMPYMWAAVILALLYVVSVGVSRFLSPGAPEPKAMKRQGQKYEIAAARQPGFRILQFYSNSGEITRGDHIVICYGVQEARSVRLDPPAEDIQPAENRCIAAAPTQTTTYTLVAEDAEGHTEQAAFTVKVNPPAPKFLFVSVSDDEIRRGEPLSVCYGLKDARSARLEPLGMALAPGEKRCIQFFPPATAKYTLVATGDGGRKAEAAFQLTVK